MPRLVQPLLLQKGLEVPERGLLVRIEVAEVAVRVAEVVAGGADSRLDPLSGRGGRVVRCGHDGGGSGG